MPPNNLDAGQPLPVRVALAGQPNAGKSALFNRLTGSTAQVANYPGVTVERRVGRFALDGQRFEVLDLPGSYSLSSFSPEERVTQQELLEQPPEVVVVVVDLTTLERSLVFLAQVMLTRAVTILCLNMADEARRSGQRIDIGLMSGLLGIPVLETEGHHGVGVAALREAIARAAASPTRAHRLVLGERLTRALAEVRQALAATACRPDQRDWIGLKLLMADPAFVARIEAEGEAGRAALATARAWRERIEGQTGQDIALFVSERFAGFVDGLLREVTLRRRRADARVWSDRIDGLLAHQVLGLPIFGLVMFAIFYLTFAVGAWPVTWIEDGFSLLAGWIGGLWPVGSASALRSLLVDGIIRGVGGVIVFLPNILLLFFGLALLEDTGYMARAAHLVDHLMHRFGLHGKSFLPLLTGFGCSIPGILATRTLENERDRLITMLVLPLMSCGARLPIWMLLIPAFFPPAWQAPMLWLIYTTGIGLALVLAKLLRHTLFRGEEAPFVMELPPYRWPTLRGLLAKMRERSWLYLRKAGTIILAISVLMWLITSYPKPDAPAADPQARSSTPASEHQRAAEALEDSIAGRMGRALEPVLAPIGLDWKLATALVGAFAAKEVFVAQMGIIYALGDADETTVGLRNSLAHDYSLPTALSLMLFLLIATPCMATVVVTRRESGRWRWALLQFFGLTAIAYVICLLVYQIGRILL